MPTNDPTNASPTIVIAPTATTLPDDGFVVFCRNTRSHHCSNQVFKRYQEAYDYAQTVAPSRNPVIIPTSEIHTLISQWYPARRSRDKASYGRPTLP